MKLIEDSLYLLLTVLDLLVLHEIELFQFEETFDDDTDILLYNRN